MTNIMLSKEAFEASRKFIEAVARPLDVARFRYEFDGAPREAVLDSLRDFQNSDGGFGHALDPDLRAPESSALCTSIAFQILRSVEATPDQALVSTGVSYLLDTFDEDQGCWRIIPESTERSPHAPWWNQKGRKDKFDSFSLNPTSEILGYLYDFKKQVPNEILSLVSDRVLGNLSSVKKIEMHDLLCCLRLLQTRTLPKGYCYQFRATLTHLIDGTIALDPLLWKGYCLRPLQVVDSPESPFMEELESAVAANLDYEISSRNEDGSWTPTWSWDDAFPEAWAKAEREWSGVITLEKLLILKRFKRIGWIV